jgi:hypothetical protein
MSEQEPPDGRKNFERFEALRLVQQELERRGYFLHPVPREHTEATITDPLVHRIRTQIRKRGLEKMAGRVSITFSGYAEDEREIFAIPEIRRYWRALDSQLPELPALLAYLPELNFNGPGNHLMLLGTIDEAVHRPELGGYDVYVTGIEPILVDALARIQHAGVTHRLRPITVKRLMEQFVAGASHRLSP